MRRAAMAAWIAVLLTVLGGCQGSTDPAAVLPKTVDGQPFAVTSYSGEEIFSGAASEDLGDPSVFRNLVARLGKGQGDLSAALGKADAGYILSVRVAGADTSELRSTFLQIAQEASGGDEVDLTLGGKDVTKFSPSGNAYAYVKDDLLFVVAGVDDDAAAASVFSTLP